jgi:hypothetical protein
MQDGACFSKGGDKGEGDEGGWSWQTLDLPSFILACLAEVLQPMLFGYQS